MPPARRRCTVGADSREIQRDRVFLSPMPPVNTFQPSISRIGLRRRQQQRPQHFSLGDFEPRLFSGDGMLRRVDGRVEALFADIISRHMGFSGRRTARHDDFCRRWRLLPAVAFLRARAGRLLAAGDAGHASLDGMICAASRHRFSMRPLARATLLLLLR